MSARNPIGEANVDDKAVMKKDGQEIKDSEDHVDSIDKAIIANKEALKTLDSFIEHFP